MATSVRHNAGPSSDEYFMGIAALTAQTSASPSTKLGACVVNADKQIVGVGCNTLVAGNDWNNAMLVTSPAVNAVLQAKGNAKNGTIYLVQFPDHESAKVIVQAGLSTVVFAHGAAERSDTYDAADTMFGATGITYKKLDTNTPAPTVTRTTPPTSAVSAAAPPVEISADTPAGADTTVPIPAASEAPEAAAPAAPAPATPAPTQQPQDAPVPLNFYAESMTMDACIKAVMSSSDGDFLIRPNDAGDRVLIVKDDTVVRTYTMKASGNGSWLFGARTYPTLRSIVALLKKTPIKSKSGKMILLGNPAPGGTELKEVEPASVGGAAPTPLPATPGGTVKEEDGCSIM
eukprot:m.291899 g.291899  ORF g.291899 m.291899 type:complete len:346 (+) comp19987_c0_seq7:212-1249(+)